MNSPDMLSHRIPLHILCLPFVPASISLLHEVEQRSLAKELRYQLDQRATYLTDLQTALTKASDDIERSQQEVVSSATKARAEASQAVDEIIDMLLTRKKVRRCVSQSLIADCSFLFYQCVYVFHSH